MRSEPPRLRAIVLAGGSGRRLQDLVRRIEARPLPKQFCSFGEPRTLLQATVDRLDPLVAPQDAVIIVSRPHGPTARTQLGRGQRCEVLSQPRDRGTAPGLLYPLTCILADDNRAIVVVTPSAHAVADAALFREGIDAVRRAVEAGLAEVVLFGVTPDAPCSDHGWIMPGGELGPNLRNVAGFVEKPTPEVAEALRVEGALLSTMVLVARGAALLDLFRRQLPAMAAEFRALGQLPSAARPSRLEHLYAGMDNADFSRDILGPSRPLAVYRWPAAVGWCDLGTPERLLATLHRRSRPGSVTSSTLAELSPGIGGPGPLHPE